MIELTERLDQLKKLLERQRGKRALIVLHAYPDPDAIASAYAFQLACRQSEIESDIVYAGEISHQQNIAMVKLLGIEMIRFAEGFEVGNYDFAIFLDTQGVNAEPITSLVDEKLPICVVIDHHEPQDRISAEFSDISPAGSVSTKLTEYIEAGLMPMSRESKSHQVAATALMHGIISDTRNFLAADENDFHAAGFLSQFADTEILRQIQAQARSKQTMEIIYKALGNRVTVEGYSIAGVGYIRPGDRDAVPQSADFLLTEANTHTVIVYGIVRGSDGSETLVGSMRTSKIVMDPDDFIKDVFGKNNEGEFYGGGKAGAGAFKIPIGFLSGEQDEAFQTSKWDLYDQQIKHKIFAKIGTQPEQ
jgi:nanoRNase/pAp phosphatase (c-di-AMP/oligoRNAs hydrolase)